MTSPRILASIMTLLLLATGLQAFAQLDGVVGFSYWQTGHVFEVGSGPRSDHKWVSFSPAFAYTPRISLSIKQLDASKDKNLRIDTSYHGASQYGFWLSVNTWADTKIYAVAVSWIAYTP